MTVFPLRLWYSCFRGSDERVWKAVQSIIPPINLTLVDYSQMIVGPEGLC